MDRGVQRAHNLDVQRVTNLFGMDYFPDEGLMNHSLHTAIVDGREKLVANIEGNQFSADQLADLVQTVLNNQRGSESQSQAHLTHGAVLASSASER